MAVKKKRVPLGNPLPKTTDDYTEPAPAQADLENAERELHERWKLHAPAHLKDLFDKTVFSYDIARMCYIEIATGKVVPKREIMMAMSKVSQYARVKK